MKLFSWSNLFFLLSLAFLWGCGYWVWWQYSQNLQNRSQELLSIQLERAEVVLGDWQHSNQLHLEYLQNALQGLSHGHDNPLYDPVQELDDRVQRTRWPDPLLGYALLDEAGRAVLLSNHSAGNLYPLTAVGASQQRPFLPPLVKAKQWIAPLQLALGNQYLVLWFDVSALQQRLQRLANGQGELLLINTAGELLSPSRYESLLLQRFISSAADERLLRWSLKRPPEDLSRSKQKYDSSTAWPPTALASAISQKKNGITPLFVHNYLGTPSVAAWRWSDGWQAFVVAELDLSKQQGQRLQLRRYLLGGLTALSVVLLLIFWRLQRSNETSVEPSRHTTNSTEHSVQLDPGVRDDGVLEFGTGAVNIADAALNDTAPNEQALQSAAGLLQAWLAGQLSAEQLKQVSQDWLSQHQFTPLTELVLAAPQLLLAQLLQSLQTESSKNLHLSFSPDLQRWYWLSWPLLLNWLLTYLVQRLQAADVGELTVRLLVAEPGVLRLELSDDGQPMTQSGWQQLLHSSPQAWQTLQETGVTASQFSELFSGNKLVLTLPATAEPTASDTPELQFVDATALLLCQPGTLQQQHCRQLKQTGVNLLPLDDASQFVSWCAAHPQQQLDYLLVDDSAVRYDPALLAQVCTVVRRYFPQVNLLLLANQSAAWQSLCQSFDLRVVAKPALLSTLQQALQARVGGIFAASLPELQLYCSKPLQVLLLQQQLQSLGYRSRLQDLKQVDLSGSYCCLYPIAAADAAPSAAVLWYQLPGEAVGAPKEPALFWDSNAGLPALSQQIFLLLQKKRIE